MKKIYLLTLFSFFLLLVGGNAYADFVLVDDFETYSTGEIAGKNDDGTPLVGSVNPASEWRTNAPGQFDVTREGAGINQVLVVKGTGIQQWLTLPTMPDIADDTSATVYYRMKPKHTASNSGYDMRNGPSVAPINAASSATTGILLDGTNFESQNRQGTTSFANTDHWFHFWVYVDNDADKYTIYYRPETGGVESASILMANVGFDQNPAPTAAITDFLLSRWNGPDVAYYVDDIYIDLDGLNQSIPGVATVKGIRGSEEVTAHEDGDVLTVSVDFARRVELSDVGGAKITLDIAGQSYDAVHTGGTSGLSLTFELSLPNLTAPYLKVQPNSLQLTGGATLIDSAGTAVDLGHPLFSLYKDRLGEGQLSVYPAVTNLDASPRYSFRVRKVSTNTWLEPFPWFTKCIDYVNGLQSAYFHKYIGSWSHTYCNFEMDSDTLVEIEITKLDGAITSAAPHPAKLVSSCKVRGGKAYVIMKNPAQVAVDINGQLDSRDAPRALPTGFGANEFPYRTPETAIHTVSIFANPFIHDKPDVNDPKVHVVQVGASIPVNDGSWETLAFAPGIHNLTPNNQEWDINDPLQLNDYRNYYIPGDAIVYGNLSDYGGLKLSNYIRVFGHGTLSGNKIPHYNDFVNPSYQPSLPSNLRSRLRMVTLDRARGCTFEGITISDQAEHGVRMDGRFVDDGTNYVKWMKAISWRVNNDGMGVTGNGYLEDSFMRHQDDGTYVGGLGIRRMVYWSDVNGTPLRASFIAGKKNETYPSTFPDKLYVEDIHIIYSRAVFSGPDSRDNGIISFPGGMANETLADGSLNTGQHIVFRNINVEDLRPTRYLLGFEARFGLDDQGEQIPYPSELAGLTFENINVAKAQTFGWPNRLWGLPTTEFRNFIFKDVYIDGEVVDQEYVDDYFETQHVSDLVFMNSGNAFTDYMSKYENELTLAQREFSADPDGDGISNGVEAMLGTEPTEFTQTPGPSMSIDDGSFNFWHPKNNRNPTDLNITYQWSMDLIDWYKGDGIDGPTGGATLNLNVEDFGQGVLVTPADANAFSRLFFRVKVGQETP